MKEKVEEILRGCGELLLSLSTSDRSVGQWQGSQFKAHADDLANEYLVSHLKNSFNLPIISEEIVQEPIENLNDYFIIDPIDGTASFAHGFPGWVTQLAYVQNEKPIMSAIFAPVTNEFFFAEKGKGVFKNNSSLKLTDQTKTSPFSVIDNYPEPKGITEELFNEMNIQEYVESGSIGLKICRIAEQKADLFFKDMTPRDWDLLPPMLILEEAGGTLIDKNGDPFKFGTKEKIHNGLIAAINPTIAKNCKDWYSKRS